jgi:branched-subunit amino acid aminotransferase/4-amino-4-deoxychorismate lyase
MRIRCSDDPVTPAELAEADEIFLTSSVREIAPVDTVDGRSLIAPGPITTAVMGAYAAAVLIERES